MKGFYVFYTFLCDTGTSSELFYAFIKDLEDVAKEKFVRIKAGVKYTSSVPLDGTHLVAVRELIH